MCCDPESLAGHDIVEGLAGCPGRAGTGRGFGGKKLGFSGEMRKECIFMVKNNHIFQVPDHPVIAAMERYGEYRESRERERRRPLPGEEERGKLRGRRGRQF